jgi:hypothetical protein
MNDADRLLVHAFKDERGFVATFSGSRAAVGEKALDAPRSAYFRYPKESTRALDWIRSEDAGGVETYFCAHLLTGRRRVKTNAAPLTTLYVDGDGAEPGPETPMPTAVVESSPGREHYYWRLTRPVAPEVGESLNRRLALEMGGDRSGWDLTQLLRSPGTRNRKYPDSPLVTLRELHPDAAHDPDELDRMLPPIPENKPRQTWPAYLPGGADLDDTELIRRGAAAANGAKFVRLWSGDTDGYGSGGNEGHSEADLALCSMLAFWTGPDEDRIDALFRRSGLMRPKWDERHYGDGRTYGRGTIGKALKGRTEFFEPPLTSRSKARRVWRSTARV